MGSECRRKEQSGGRRMREWLISLICRGASVTLYIEGHNNNINLNSQFLIKVNVFWLIN